MKYRDIGTTGMKASVVGLGTEHLDNKPYALTEQVIRSALEHDINIMDVFMPGHEVRQNIGKSLGNRRKDVLIQGHIGSVDLNQQYDMNYETDICKKYFENLMKDLNTDYIDFGMLFFLDSEETFQKVFHGDLINYVVKLKEQGTIRAIGASSHNPKIAKKVVETGLVDLLMFSVNPAFDMTPIDVNSLDTLENLDKQDYIGIEPARAELYKVCANQNVAITTMGAGKLLTAAHSPFGKPLTVQQCMHYALTRPAVVSTLVGCDSVEQVEEMAKYLQMTEEELDYTDVIGNFKSFQGSCVYCNHCLPCPSNIDIASVNRYLDIAKLNETNIPPSIVQHYNSLNAHGGDCISCGSCEGKCPFGVPVIENMGKAAELFGK